MAWLEQLERGEMVVVNLRPATDDQTQFTRFDHARVMRVLARITSDLDELARRNSNSRRTTKPSNYADLPSGFS